MTPAWSVLVIDVASGERLIEESPDLVLRTASIGKLLLLITVARQVTDRTLDPKMLVERTDADIVADSGVWQHLEIDALSVHDLCVLIASASDNLATNVLLRHVGLPEVARAASDLGLRHTALLDRVRDARGPDDAWTLSTGTATELAGLMVRLSDNEVFDPATSELVLDWLGHGLDLSMVASSWGLDPLAHSTPDRGLWLQHKTGTDDGVRGDVGLLQGPARTVAYAALANWDPAGPDLRDRILDRMRLFGAEIGVWVSGVGGPVRRAPDRDPPA